MLSIPHMSRNPERRRRARAAASEAQAQALAAPPPLALALLPDSAQLVLVEQPRAIGCERPPLPRRVRRRAKNCRNLARFGHEHAGFRRLTARDQRAHVDLERVQHQVWELEQKRVLLQSIALVRHANATALVADKVHDYYLHFSRGYDPRGNVDHGNLLESLLRSIMTDDVESPAFRDIDTFLLQWENYSRYHAEMLLEVEMIQPLASEDPSMYLVKVQGMSRLRISRDTIKHFFKPLLEDEAMVQRLIGKEYVFPFVTLFYFNLDGRVFRMEPRADLASGLFNLVTDPFATVKLLGASQLTDDGCLHAYPESEYDASSSSSDAACFVDSS
ncbi:hypothetical protein PybrP1_009536 [[Pythium] brassicae (nom. inval.)]|nr:hypothetical protein PybrP1_009536 [[Pythium] brassicae (nom. inval.)]